MKMKFLWLMLVLQLLIIDSFHSILSYNKRYKLVDICMKYNSLLINELLIPNDFQSFIERKNRPKHVGIPRKRMDLQFAIQLMRNSYNIVDELDFVPMDEFQKDFFLFRQSEWEDYRNYHPNTFQGDLSDPLYFDFISFSQYAVISYKMKYGKLDFIEKIGAEGSNQVVKRAKIYENNDILPIVHSELVGDKLLDFMIDKYPSITPVNLSRNFTQVNHSIDEFESYSQLILDIFTINSYDLDASIMRLPSISSTTDMKQPSVLFQIKLKAPANLWSLQLLKQRNDLPRNDFEIKVLEAIARRCKLKLTLVSTEVINQIDVLHLIKIV